MPIADIEASGYNLNIKNPQQVGEEPVDPEHLLANYRSLLAEHAETRDTLKREPATVLERTS